MDTEHPPNSESQSAAAVASARAIRTPDQRVRVFLSSTLDELAPERAAAREAITQLRLTPVFYESGARPYPPREIYRAYLAQSDIFIGIYWQRYGWVAPDMQVSGLEDEYQLSSGKPRLIYIKMPAPQREQRLQALLDSIRTEYAASYQKFSTAEELAERIANDLSLLLTERFTHAPETPVVARLATLPRPRSRLIDRQKELAQAEALLQQQDVGLVTLTGPGGVGKTRLALQAAANQASQFADGVAYISLASLKNPHLILPTVARALGLSNTGSTSVKERLLEYLRPRNLLLVLDNAEQLVSAAWLTIRTLELAPKLKLLVTSREPLRVRDERIMQVLPLKLLDSPHLPDPQHLLRIPAVALFVERARKANPNFALTAENAAVIVEICQRLDGLPLALELAAASLSLLTPAALLQRLAHRLPLLTRGARDLPQRQQTMRNTIAWSYDLLEAGEQRLFRRLAVFIGGFTLEAVQSICILDADSNAPSPQADDGTTLEQLAQLLDKNLMRTQRSRGGEPRFTMLETIHEYATEQLQASGEEAALQERHAHYFLRVVEEAEPHLFNPEGDIWLERLEREEANLRAALTWCKANKDAVEIALRLVGGLSFYWFLHSTVSEGRKWLEEMLERTGSTDRSAARGKALWGSGVLAWAEADFEAASRWIEESLSIWRELGDKRYTAYTESWLGLVLLSQKNIVAARPLFEESLALLNDLGDVWGEAFTLYQQGNIAYVLADIATARAHYEESVRLFRQVGAVLYAIMSLCSLKVVVSLQRDEETVRSLSEQLQTLLQQATNRGALGMLLINTGDIWLHHNGDEHQAQVYYREGLSLWQDLQDIDNGSGIIKALAGLAEVAAAQGQAERAGQLFGAADHLLPSFSIYREEVKRRLSAARVHLDTATFEAGMSVGQAMTQEQALNKALQEV